MKKRKKNPIVFKWGSMSDLRRRVFVYMEIVRKKRGLDKIA